MGQWDEIKRLAVGIIRRKGRVYASDIWRTGRVYYSAEWIHKILRRMDERGELRWAGKRWGFVLPEGIQ